jgi:GPH family glycoside/pentoside/hexuronide:cation symporter
VTVTTPGAAAGERLGASVLATYAYPVVGVSFLTFLFSAYFFKFATDTLLLAPAAMGLIYAAARIWDAVSDPMAGYLSDRTRTRLGRRRPWLLASVIPIAFVPVMIWSPPGFLDGTPLIVWMTAGILLYETALTIFIIPHTALGAELTTAHHERTRIFAFRHVAWMGGFFINAGAIYLLTTAEDTRRIALLLSSMGGAAAAALILTSSLKLREKAEHLGRAGSNPYRALGDILRNPNARLLLLVFLIENLGTATLGILTPFFMEYVVHAREALTFVLLFHFVPSIAIAPACVRLTKRFGKKAVWATASLISAVSYTGFFFTGSGEVAWMLFCTIGTGIGLGIGSVVGPSVQADVIDYDEYQTGERKEGSYFAVWNFIRKAAAGITGIVVGFSLQAAGFVPGIEQSANTQLAISVMFAGLPAVSLVVGTALFIWKFDLTEDEHHRIRVALDVRNGSDASAGR